MVSFLVCSPRSLGRRSYQSSNMISIYELRNGHSNLDMAPLSDKETAYWPQKMNCYRGRRERGVEEQYKFIIKPTNGIHQILSPWRLTLRPLLQG